MLIAYGLLAAPIIATILSWGTPAWAAASAVVAAIEYAALQRSARFGARVWRSIGFGRRRKKERAAEAVYVVSAAAGVLALLAALLRLG